jgi:hypothetical protein
LSFWEDLTFLKADFSFHEKEEMQLSSFFFLPLRKKKDEGKIRRERGTICYRKKNLNAGGHHHKGKNL